MKCKRDWLCVAVFALMVIAGFAAAVFYQIRAMDAEAPTPPIVMKKPEQPALVGQWRLDTWGDGQAVTSTDDFFLSFDARKLSGRFCNSFSGDYQLTDNRLTALVVSTEMACDNQSLMEVESQLFAGLSVGWMTTVNGEELILSDSVGERRLVFKRRP